MIINHIKFPFYGVLIVLSIVLGLLYIYKSLYREKKYDKNIFLFILMYVLFAFIIGKLYTVIISIGKENLNIFTAGLSSYGGLIGVVLAAIIFEKILPLNNNLIKYTVISLPLTYGIGKIGCFLAGCCYGIPYDGIFSVTYPFGLNIPLFPIQLLEAILFIILFFVFNKFKNSKYIIYIVLISSSIFKFLLDFLRYEHTIMKITSNQIFSIVLVIVAVISLLISKKRNFC